MEPMTIREIMDAVGGKLLGEFGDINRMVGRVETDSRTIHAGSLFVPLVGERFDGHAYINAALEGGAAGCFTQRERESYLPGKFYIKVDSTQRALRDLAKYYKKKFPIPVVALTGSVGKTTTKDMVAAVLGEKYRVLKTEGNLNNEIDHAGGQALALVGHPVPASHHAAAAKSARRGCPLNEHGQAGRDRSMLAARVLPHCHLQ